MRSRIITREEAEERARDALEASHAQHVSVWNPLVLQQRACPLMPSVRHCWHEQLRFWDTLFPPAMVCCWCGEETEDSAAVPHRHGPHAEMR